MNNIQAVQHSDRVIIKYKTENQEYEAIFTPTDNSIVNNIEMLHKIISEAITSYKTENDQDINLHLDMTTHRVTIRAIVKIGIATSFFIELISNGKPVSSINIHQPPDKIRISSSSPTIVYGHYYSHNKYVRLSTPGKCKILDLKLNIKGRTVNLYQECIATIQAQVIRLQLSACITKAQLKGIRNPFTTTIVISGNYTSAKDIFCPRFNTRLPKLRRIVFEGIKPPPTELLTLIQMFPNITVHHINPRLAKLDTVEMNTNVSKKQKIAKCYL